MAIVIESFDNHNALTDQLESVMYRLNKARLNIAKGVQSIADILEFNELYNKVVDLDTRRGSNWRNSIMPLEEITPANMVYDFVKQIAGSRARLYKYYRDGNGNPTFYFTTCYKFAKVIERIDESYGFLGAVHGYVIRSCHQPRLIVDVDLCGETITLYFHRRTQCSH